MDMLATLRDWLLPRPLQPLAEEIAARSRNEVWQMVHARARGMSVAEARGYIRIRARQVVRNEVGVALAEHAIRPTDVARLERMTLECVMQQAHIDLVRLPHWQAVGRAA